MADSDKILMPPPPHPQRRSSGNSSSALSGTPSVSDTNSFDAFSVKTKSHVKNLAGKHCWLCGNQPIRVCHAFSTEDTQVDIWQEKALINFPLTSYLNGFPLCQPCHVIPLDANAMIVKEDESFEKFRATRHSESFLLLHSIKNTKLRKALSAQMRSVAYTNQYSLSLSCTPSVFHSTSHHTSIILGPGMGLQPLVNDGPCMPWVAGWENSVPQLDNSFGSYKNYTFWMTRMFLLNTLRRVVKNEVAKVLIRVEDQRTQMTIQGQRAQGAMNRMPKTQTPTQRQRNSAVVPLTPGTGGRSLQQQMQSEHWGPT